MKPLDADLRFAQLAVRMGMIQAQDLPALLQEARTARERSKERESVPVLGQILVRKKVLSVGQYLQVARETKKSTESQESLDAIDRALDGFESGVLDEAALADVIRSSAAEIPIPVEDTAAPPRFGRYELLGEIARGGMGIVYRARDTETGKVLALKVMIEADDDPARLARFRLEAKLASALDHPGIVRVYDAGIQDGMPYLTMDLVPGKGLDDLLEGGLDRNEALRLLAQVARAADHAHRHGVVHRDLKPGNILVDARTHQARVTDFGLARDLDQSTRITRAGQAVGTPYYMSPEQVRGERDVDGRADVYAIGIMAYEVLTGDVPFNADSALSLFKKIDKEPANLPLDPAKGIDEGIRAIVLRALEKKRDDRYATAKLLAEDLERYVEGKAPRARARTQLDRLAGALSHRKREIATLGLGLAVVLAIFVLVASFASGVASREQLEAGARDAEEALARARTLLESAETALATNAEAALAAAREAREKVESAERLTRGSGPYGQGAREVVEREGLPVERSLAVLGKAQAALGHYAEADATLARAARERRGPADTRLLLLLATVRLREGETSAALEALDEAVRTDSTDALALVERGETRLLAGKLDGAIDDLSLAIGDARAKSPAERARPLLARAGAHLARSARSGQSPAERADALRLAATDALDASKQAPLLAEPVVLAGDVARARGDDAAALEQYALAARREPSSPLPWLRRGDLLLARGASELAARAFEQAIGSPTGGSWEALLGRGLARAHAFELELALQDLRSAAREAAVAPLGPRELPQERLRSRARCHVALSEVARALGDAASARAALEEGVAAAPSVADVRVALARLLLERSPPDHDGASRQLERARAGVREEGPEAASVLEALARLKLAKGELEAAQQLADLAVAALGKGHHARARRACALVRYGAAHAPQASAGAANAARAAAEAARTDAAFVSLDPRDAERQEDLAAVLLRQGSREAALARALSRPGKRAQAELAAAALLDPLRAPAHLALAESYESEGKLELARDSAERCLEVDPLDAAAHEVAARVLLALARREDEAADERKATLAKARAHADSAVSLEENAERLELRAIVCNESGDEAGARKDLEAALARSPSLVLVEALLSADPDAFLAQRLERRHALLEQARSLEAKDPARARDLAGKAAGIGDIDDREVREAFVVSARLAGKTDPERLDLVAQALRGTDTDLLDAADAFLGSPVPDPLLDLAREAELERRARTGNEAAAVTLALAVLEDELSGARARNPRERRSLDLAEVALSAAPSSLAAWAAHALAAERSGDELTAERELALLREAAPRSALLAFIEAETAARAGDEARSGARLEEARALGLHLADERIRGSPVLSKH